MWIKRLTEPRKRLVDAGRVYCPVQRRDIDVDRCYSCPELLEFALDTRKPYVSCRPVSPTDPEPASR